MIDKSNCNKQEPNDDVDEAETNAEVVKGTDGIVKEYESNEMVNGTDNNNLKD